MTAGPTVAVILAAGRGTRMMADATAAADLDEGQRAMARAGLKMLVPFAGRPFLAWVLDAVADAGFPDACLVVSGATRAVAEEVRSESVRITTVEQDSPRGTADAVLAAERELGDRAFIVINSDNWYPPEALSLLRAHEAPATIGFRPGDRVGSFALMATDAAGCLAEIVEKPGPDACARLGPDALVSMTCWSFTPAIFEACRAIDPSVRGELELPDAVRRLVADGQCVPVLPHEGPVLDLSRAADVPTVAAQLAVHGRA